MTRKKIHIDELFRDKLKSLSLLVSNKDMEAIDGKKSQFTDTEGALNTGPFSDFELELTDMDWLSTKSKLDIERAAISNKDAFQEKFDGFEIEPNAEDWPITYQKYLAAKSKKIWWWLGTGILALLIGLSIWFTSGVRTENSENTLAQNKIHTNENAQNRVSITSEGNAQSPAATNLHKDLGQRLNSEAQSNIEVESKKVRENKLLSKQSSLGNTYQNVIPLEKKIRKKTISNPLEDLANKPFDLYKPNVLALGKLENKPELNNDPSNEIADNVRNKEFPGEIQVPKLKSANVSADTVKKKIFIDDYKKPGKAVLGLYVAMVNQINYGYRVLSKGNNDFYNSIRKNADKASISWTKGIEVGILKYKTQFSIGLQACGQTMVSNYKYSYKVYDSLPVYNPGRTKIIGYFLLHGRDTFINEENKVKMNKIQVPLAFSRIVSFGTKTSLILGTAVVIDYCSKTTGTKMLNPQNNQLYYYQALAAYERKINVLPSLSLGVNYQLGKNLMLQSSAHANTALFGRFKNNFAANEQAYNFGINLKLLYLIK